MQVTRSGFLAAWMAVWTVSNLSAAENPFGLIPSQTSLVVRISKPSSAITKLEKCADHLQPAANELKSGLFQGDESWGETIRYWADLLLQPLADRADLEQDLWVYQSSIASDDFDFVVIMPAKDPAALLAYLKEKSQDENATGFIHNSWVVFGPRNDVEQTEKCARGEMAALNGALDPESLALFSQGDIGVFLNLGQTRESSGVTLDDLQIALRTAFGGFGFEMEPKQTAESLKDVANQLTDAVAQTIFDLESITVRLNIDQDFLYCEPYLKVADGSSTAQFLQANPASEMRILDSLPAFSAIYFGFHGDQQALMTWATKTLQSIAGETKTELSTRLQVACEEYRVLNYGTFATAFPMNPLQQGLIRSISITEVDHPQRARELDRKYHDLWKEFSSETGSKESPLELDAEKYRDLTADIFTMPCPLDLGAAFPVGIPDLQKKFEHFLYGPDANLNRTLYLKDRVVRLQGGSKVRTAAVVHRITESGEKAQSAERYFQQTREKLGTTANLILMIDAGRLTAVSMQLWNGYIDLMTMLAGNVPMAIEADEVTDEAQKVEESDENQFGMDDIEQADHQQEAEAVDGRPVKFSDATISSMTSNPSLIGCSATFEPQACRARIVVPFDSVKKLIKAADITLKRLGIDEAVEPVIEMEAADPDE